MNSKNGSEQRKKWKNKKLYEFFINSRVIDLRNKATLLKADESILTV